MLEASRLEDYLSALEAARDLGTLDEDEFEAVSELAGWLAGWRRGGGGGGGRMPLSRAKLAWLSCAVLCCRGRSTAC